MADWEDLDPRYRQQLVDTFEELMRAEVIFAGPSLYSASDLVDPSV